MISSVPGQEQQSKVSDSEGPAAVLPAESVPRGSGWPCVRKGNCDGVWFEGAPPGMLLRLLHLQVCGRHRGVKFYPPGVRQCLSPPLGSWDSC